MLYLRMQTNAREEMLDITPRAQSLIAKAGWLDGAVLIYCPHTTCGLTINEGADPDVQRDIVSFLQELAAHKSNWLHAEGNSDAHIKASLLGSSLMIPLENGRFALGRWQSIFLYEGDGPRSRTICFKFIGSNTAV